jgi:N-acetylmuramoyl-L-alanine amidase
MPCVGLVVLAGCLNFIIAPDDEFPASELQPANAGNGLPTIVIDAGHGGRDEGAKGNGLVEKDLCLDVALRLEEELKALGFPTVMTRRDDVHVRLSARAALANRFEHALFVSVHFNQSGYRTAKGVETYYANAKLPTDSPWSWVGFFTKQAAPEDNGEDLAAFVHLAVLDGTEAADRGVKGRELYVVRHVRVPAVLVEGGFLSNAMEAKMLGLPEYRQRLATSIAQGVAQFQSNQPRPPAPVQLAKVVP